MTYTRLEKRKALTLQTISPLDPNIIRARFSVRIPNYRTRHTDTAIETYAQLLLRGAGAMDKDALESYLKRNGIFLSVSGGIGTLDIGLTVRAGSAKKAGILLEDLIFRPTLPKRELEQLRAMLLEQNREAHDDAKELARVNFVNLIYPKDSMMHEETLSEERALLTTLSRKELVALKNDIAHGEWLITMSGDTTSARSFAPLLKKLEKTARLVLPPSERTNAPKVRQQYVTVHGKTNVELRMGNTLSLTPGDADSVPLEFGIAVLGMVGGFAGRLMSTVREKEGLTYGIYARTTYRDITSCGHWEIITFFMAKDLKRGIESTRRELESLLRDGITPEELSVFKELTKNRFLIAHESDNTRVGLYHQALLSGRTEAMLDEQMERMARVTVDEVNRALRTHLDPDTLVFSGAGPVTKTGKGIL